jgi:hypothetical protein
VTTTGNLIIDFLHNFHLECGARIRIHPTTAALLGYDRARLRSLL